MNQVLGHSAGNAVEVQEAVDFLKGVNIDSRLHLITIELCSELLVSAQICNNLEEAKNKLQRVLDTGLALEKFAQMISALGGPSDFCEKANQYLPQAPIIRPVYPQQSGFVHSMDTRGICLSIIELKGGRTTPDQKLDYSTGYTQFCQIGQQIDTQTPLAFVHAASEEQFAKAADNLQKLITITDKAPQSFPDIIEKIS
jgi:thymidine phosphorylase